MKKTFFAGVGALIVFLFIIPYTFAKTPEEILKMYNGGYKEVTDEFNKGWGQKLIVETAAMVQAFAAKGDIVSAAFFAQMIELPTRDAYYCAVGNQQRASATREINRYSNVKNELIQRCPSQCKAQLIALLEKQKEYYYQTKTRGAGFSKACQRKVLAAGQ